MATIYKMRNHLCSSMGRLGSFLVMAHCVITLPDSWEIYCPQSLLCSLYALSGFSKALSLDFSSYSLLECSGSSQSLDKYLSCLSLPLTLTFPPVFQLLSMTSVALSGYLTAQGEVLCWVTGTVPDTWRRGNSCFYLREGQWKGNSSSSK